VFNDKFNKLDNDCWTSMFDVKCIIKLSILNAILLMDTMSKALVFVKSKICLYCTIIIFLEL
jgi:hypothetical protein